MIQDKGLSELLNHLPISPHRMKRRQILTLKYTSALPVRFLLSVDAGLFCLDPHADLYKFVPEVLSEGGQGVLFLNLGLLGFERH